MEITTTPAAASTTYIPTRLDRMTGKTWPTTIAEDIAFDPEAEEVAI